MIIRITSFLEYELLDHLAVNHIAEISVGRYENLKCCPGVFVDATNLSTYYSLR